MGDAGKMERMAWGLLCGSVSFEGSRKISEGCGGGTWESKSSWTQGVHAAHICGGLEAAFSLPGLAVPQRGHPWSTCPQGCVLGGPRPRRLPRVPAAAGRGSGAHAHPSGRHHSAGAALHGGSGSGDPARRSHASLPLLSCRSWPLSRLRAGVKGRPGHQAGQSPRIRLRPQAWWCSTPGGRRLAAPDPGVGTASPGHLGSSWENCVHTWTSPRGTNSWLPNRGHTHPSAAAAGCPRRRASRHVWGSRSVPSGGPSRTGAPRGSEYHCACVPTCRPPAARRARSSAHPCSSADWKTADSPSGAGAPGPCTRRAGWSPPGRQHICCVRAAWLRELGGGAWWLPSGKPWRELRGKLRSSQNGAGCNLRAVGCWTVSSSSYSLRLPHPVRHSPRRRDLWTLGSITWVQAPPGGGAVQHPGRKLGPPAWVGQADVLGTWATLAGSCWLEQPQPGCWPG